MLSLASSLLLPDPPVLETLADFTGSLLIQQVLARRPGLGCLQDLPRFGSAILPYVPSPRRREEDRVHISSLPRSRRPSPRLEQVGSSRTPTLASVGYRLRRFRVRFMLRPAWLLALLCQSDPGSLPAAESFYFRACSSEDHSPPESGITTRHPGSIPWSDFHRLDHCRYRLHLVQRESSRRTSGTGKPLRPTAQLRVSTSWTLRTDDRQATPQRGRTPCKSIQLSCGRIGAPISTI